MSDQTIIKKLQAEIDDDRCVVNRKVLQDAIDTIRALERNRDDIWRDLRELQQRGGEW